MAESTKMTPAAKKILETASHLFYWKGIHAIGVETIANEAGVTKKTLYDRFGSKEQLIVAYLKHRDERWKNHIHEYLNQVPDDQPMGKISAFFDALETWLTEQNQRGCAFVNAFAELTDESHPGREVILEEKQWLKDQFISYAQDLGVHKADQLGEQLLVLHEGVTVTYSMNLSPQGMTSAKESAQLLIKKNLEQ